MIWDIRKNLPKIKADPGRLEQVFINLLINARDAIEERWGLQEGAEADKKIIIKTGCEGPTVVCKICDTGLGIEPSIANKIFEPFFTTKEVGKGTGLGLSLAYDIIKKHKGHIGVESKIGVGTIFTVTLPRKGVGDNV